MTRTATHSGKLIGRALLIGNRVASEDADLLAREGLQVELTADPYAAIAELSGRPLVYRALVVPLSQLFPEELMLIRVVKRRFPHVQIIASEVPEKRVEELRKLHVDAILTETTLRPLAPPPKAEPAPLAIPVHKSSNDSQPVLTAEELRALLSEDLLPPSGTEQR